MNRSQVRVSRKVLAAATATSLLLAATSLQWIAPVRILLSSYVFFVVPGSLVVDRKFWPDRAFRWTLILGGSVGIDIVLAEALLALGLFSATHFLGVLLLLVVAVLLSNLTHRARHRVAEVKG